MYMLGLSADTKSTMNDTINYAKNGLVDIIKFGITIPFPGTVMFREMRELDCIRTYDWDEYHIYNEASEIYVHPNLSWDSILLYYKKAYIECYYKNPKYLLRRLMRSIKTGEFFSDIYLGIKFFLILLSKPIEFKKCGYAYRHLWGPLKFNQNRINSYEISAAKNMKKVVN